MNKPFDPKRLQRAQAIVAGYRLVLEPSDELGFIGTSIEVPTVFADGKNPETCVRATRQALAIAVATMLENGMRPPAGRGKRTMQVNVRLTVDEKLLLEEGATRLGFEGVSDYLRTVGLQRTSTS
ncbi:MAG: hypothetical protein FLDDKLPJ_03605 [Phycisphaerae bacterium]|nr:hypothetical protein [Phycisphaerae bacterium]